VIRRDGGETTLTRVVPFEDAPFGMALTHDGALLIAAAGDALVFIDVARLTTGTGEAVLGRLKEGRPFGRIYTNVTRDDRFVFVSDERTQSITVVDLAAARSSGFKSVPVVGTIPVGIAPIALTFSGDEHYLYTTSERAPPRLGWPTTCSGEGRAPAGPDGAIFVVDVARAETEPARSVVAAVHAGCSPVRLVTSPDGNTAYVTARSSDALLAFDTKKLLADPEHALTGRVPVGPAPVGVTLIDSGRFAIVANSNRFAGNDAAQSLTVIEVAKLGQGAGAAVSTIPAGSFPRELAVTADGHVLVLTNFASRTVELVDLTRLPVARSPQ
jgi:DNA-binding beta-propeller fold protein YncE